MIKCGVCNRQFKAITNTHVKIHGLSLKEYISKYGNIFSKKQIEYLKNKPAYNKGSCLVNHSFFKTISADMYYILGLWYADGCVCRNRNSKVALLSFNIRDEELIKQVAKTIDYNKKLYYYKDKRFGSVMVKIDIFSEEIFDDLVKLGCMERKSLIIEFPMIPKVFDRDFIRGYMDGDGSIFVNDRNKLEVTFTSGSKKFLDKLRIVVYNNIDLLGSVVYKNRKNCYFIRYAYKNRAEQLLYWLYENASLFSNRKYNIYKKFIL